MGWLPAAIEQAANPAILPGRSGYLEAAAQVSLLDVGGPAQCGVDAFRDILGAAQSIVAFQATVLASREDLKREVGVMRAAGARPMRPSSQMTARQPANMSQIGSPLPR